MPGGNKPPKCPKGEVRDKKTKLCVKKTKKSPKKSVSKSPNKNTRKVSPKNVSVKKSPISIPNLSSFELADDTYYVKYRENMLIRILKDNTSHKGLSNN